MSSKTLTRKAPGQKKHIQHIQHIHNHNIDTKEIYASLKDIKDQLREIKEGLHTIIHNQAEIHMETKGLHTGHLIKRLFTRIIFRIKDFKWQR